MPLRDWGAVPTGDFVAPEIDWSFFLKMTIPSPVGVIRWTDRWTGTFTGNIDGSSQTWLSHGFQPGPFTQDLQGGFSVQYIDLLDLDLQVTTWANSPGMRDAEVALYIAMFDPANPATLTGKNILYSGEFDDGVLGTGLARFNLKPSSPIYALNMPYKEVTPLCFYDYKDPFTCQFPGAEPVGQVTCDHTRGTGGCGGRSNLAHFGGADLLLPDGIVQHWGG